MDKEYIKKMIDEGKWYQRMKLDGVYTRDTFEYGGDFVWENIRKFLPDTLENKRVLDIGSSSGYYCVQASLLGASEVIGIEISKRDHRKALFVKEYFEHIHSKQLNIKYICEDINKLNLIDFGKFDYIFAIAVLYHLGTEKYGQQTSSNPTQVQQEFIETFSKITNNVILRTTNRQNRTTEFFLPTFEKYGFKIVDRFSEIIEIKGKKKSIGREMVLLRKM